MNLASVKTAYKTSLAARQETFLAQVPRSFKMATTVVLLLLAVTPVLLNAYEESQRAFLIAAPKGPILLTALTTEQPTSVDLEALARLKKDGEKNELSTAEEAARKENDKGDRSQRLLQAPDPELTEPTPQGLLPRIGDDGRTPWQTYARPFNALDHRPRIALVVMGLGLSSSSTDLVLQKLPPNVTLAFNVESSVVGAWLAKARQAGNETLLVVPMEPFDYPRSDPGPNTLLTNLPSSENVQRFLWALRQGTGYVGVTTFSGSRFTATPDKVMPILQSIKQRGLLVFDPRLSPHSVLRNLCSSNRIPFSASTLEVDANPSPASIETALSQLEQTARLTGKAVGVISPLPETVKRVNQWIKQLPSKGLVLAPLSSVAEQ